MAREAEPNRQIRSSCWTALTFQLLQVLYERTTTPAIANDIKELGKSVDILGCSLINRVMLGTLGTWFE